MRTSSSICSLLALTAVFAAGRALAFDASLATQMTEMPVSEMSSPITAMPLMAPNSEPMPSVLDMPAMPESAAIGESTTASEAFNMARNLYRRGDRREALTAFQFAANQGHIGAQWMMGRMYAKGDGVEPNDLKAFEFFREVANSATADELYDSPENRQNAAYISHALLQLGSYYREGIPGTYVKQDPELAARLYVRAAYNYGDPNAQFNLAVMYIEGNGVAKDMKRALQLLNNAAKKDHAPSRALLGHMMFNGEGGIKRQPEKGLDWLRRARESAEASGEADAQWIIDLHDKALATSPDAERKSPPGFLQKVFGN